MSNTDRDDVSTAGPESAQAAPSASKDRPAAAATMHGASLQRRLRRSRTLNVVLGVATAFLAVVTIAQAFPEASQAGVGSGASATAEASADQATEVPEIARRDADDPMAIGDVDAPVVLVEWADFRCPYCAVFTNETLPVILDEYVDAGLVRYEFRDVAFFGDESVDAAIAVRAAAEQGRFAEYLEVLFSAAPEQGHPDMPREKLIGFARDAGVPDLGTFEADLDRQDLRDAVLASTDEAHRLGVTSVPFFVAGDRALSGAQPTDLFRQFLDEQLEAAGETPPGTSE